MPLRASASSSSRPVQVVTPPSTEDETDTDTETGSDAENDSDTETDSDKRVIDVPVEEPMAGNVWENTSYNTFSIGADGGVYAIKRYNYSYDDYENPENSVYTRSYYLCAWNADGSFQRETEL